MQAVILAAGRGTRMGALTEAMPKPMLRVLGKPILQFQIESLPQEADEVILIVNYFGSVIQQYFGGEFGDKRILYVEQEELNGTAGALWAARDILQGKFLVMNGDDICMPEDIAECAASPDWAMLVQRVEEIGSAGKVMIDTHNRVSHIIEKEAHDGGAGFANTANFFLLDERVFSYAPVYRPGSTTEYGLPQTIIQAAKDIPIHPIEAHSIIRITEPDDLQKAEKYSENHPHKYPQVVHALSPKP